MKESQEMRACEHLREVSAYHDGELPPADAVRLEAHHAQCPVCARELSELRSLSGALKNVSVPNAPGNVMERLHETAAGARELAVITMAKRLTVAAAAVLIVSAALTWAVTRGSGPPSAGANSWEWAAVTLRVEASGDVQHVTQWIVDDLSLEKQHD